MKSRVVLLVGVALACSSATTPNSHEQVRSIGKPVVVPSYDPVEVEAIAPINPWMKAIGDLNGDGKPDLIVSGEEGPVVWYENPSWTKRTISTTAASESGSAAADIDNDGDIDVVVGRRWFENVNNASSWVSRSLSGTHGTHDIVVGDLNGDGKKDIVMRGENNTRVYIYTQNTPTSWTLTNKNPGIGLNGLDLADVNADGRVDIVVGGRWLQNVVSGTWPTRTFTTWHDYAYVKVADINGDGRQDIVLSVSEDVGKLSWFEGPANPTTGPWVEHVVATNLSQVHACVVADVNLDGALDIVASEYGGAGRLILYTNQGSGLSFSSEVLGTDDLHNIQGADLNADGVIDFFGAYAWGITPVVAYLSTQGAGGTGGAGGAPNGGGGSGGSETGGVSGSETGGTGGTGGETGGVAGMDVGGGGLGGSLAGAAGSPAGAAGSPAGAAGMAGAASIKIGETSVLPIDEYGNAGLLAAQSASLAQTATLTSISFYVNSAAGKLRLGVYNASGPSGGPGALQAATAEITPVVGWNTANVVTPVTLNAGTYWLAYAPSSNSLHFASANSGSTKYYSRTYGALPTTFGTSLTSVTFKVSIHATLNP